MELILKALAVFAIIAILIIGYFGYFIDYQTVETSLVQIQFGIDEQGYTRINGSEVLFDNKHFVKRNVLMVPLKEVLSVLGGNVIFNDDEGAFWADYMGVSVNVYPESDYVFLDETRQNLTSAPVIKEGVIFVPIDFFVKVFEFDGSNKEDYIEISKSVFKFNEPTVEKYLMVVLNNTTGKFSRRQLLKIETIKIEGEELELLDWVSYFENLKYLYLSDNKIEDISSLANLNKLAKIDLSRNKIQDISYLSKLKDLKWLNISKNNIIDASRLNANENLEWVDLSYNRLGREKIRLAQSVKNVNLSYNSIYDLSMIKALGSVDVLNVDYNPILANDSMTEIDEVRSLILWGIEKRELLVKEVDTVRYLAKDLIETLELRNISDIKIRMDIVYDYLLENTTFRKDKTDLSPRNVFENGVGGAHQIANALQVLWRMSGAEVYTYVQNVEDKEYVWNVIEDNGRFFYYDLVSDIKQGQRSTGLLVEDRFERGV